ncbi:MAG: IS4 family transposase [Bacteroidota bacterium]
MRLSKPRRISTKDLLKKVFDFIHNNKDYKSLCESDTNFTRKNKLTFSSVALTILHLFKESNEFNLATFLPSIGCAAVKGPAFSMARYKIRLSFFLELNELLTNHIKTLNPKLWNGYRLIAGDGTTVNLPPSKQIKNHFGVFCKSNTGTSTCLANACMFYDVLSNFILDSIISPVSIGEVSLLNTMLTKADYSNSILLLDRGFGSFSVCKSCINRGLNFCIRLKTANLDFAKYVLREDSTDFITTWKPSEMERSTCRKHAVDIKEITVRVTKIVLDSGEVELLVSNLFNQKTIDEASMKKLYAMRWGIEEGFKKLKPTMKLEQFGSRRYEGIYQEFYAHTFMMNMVGIIRREAEPLIEKKTQGRKHQYKYNWKNAFLFVRERFADLFYKAKFTTSLLTLIGQISESIVAIKNNRSFLRHKGTDKSRSTQCYK